jgi:hypothetical protein
MPFSVAGRSGPAALPTAAGCCQRRRRVTGLASPVALRVHDTRPLMRPGRSGSHRRFGRGGRLCRRGRLGLVGVRSGAAWPGFGLAIWRPESCSVPLKTGEPHGAVCGGLPHPLTPDEGRHTVGRCLRGPRSGVGGDAAAVRPAVAGGRSLGSRQWPRVGVGRRFESWAGAAIKGWSVRTPCDLQESLIVTMSAHLPKTRVG